MTEELINDLRDASQWLGRPIDGSLAHMLVEEVIRLRGVVNDRQSEVNQFKADLENKVARLTQAIQQRRDVDAESQSNLYQALAEAEEQYKHAKRAIDRQNLRLIDLRELLTLCNDASGEPQAAQIVRPNSLPERPTGDVGEAWVQINEIHMRKLEKIPHTIHKTIYGVYFDRRRDNVCFAFRLLDGRSFALKSLLISAV